MFAVVVAACVMQPAPVEMDGVRLADAHRFGVSREAVRPLWQLSYRAPEIMRLQVAAHNSPDVAQVWEAECNWRARCWYLLDDAIYCDSLTEQQKVRSLAELRSLIGDAAYEAGVMPTPCCRYRPWSD